MDAWYPDDGASSVIGKSSDERDQHRRSLWAYYDRRVTGRLPGLANAHAYWTGLGVTVEIEDIAAEAAQLERLLRELSAGRFVEVGAGPGTFTRYLSASGIAIDQSRKALDVLRTEVPGVPVIQADATALPVGPHAVDRFFSAHLYGLLLPGERESFLAEAHRVASEVVILDAGRPQGVSARSGKSGPCRREITTESSADTFMRTRWPPKSAAWSVVGQFTCWWALRRPRKPQLPNREGSGEMCRPSSFPLQASATRCPGLLQAVEPAP